MGTLQPLTGLLQGVIGPSKGKITLEEDSRPSGFWAISPFVTYAQSYSWDQDDPFGRGV
jgi:hypothetical protein